MKWGTRVASEKPAVGSHDLRSTLSGARQCPQRVAPFALPHRGGSLSDLNQAQEFRTRCGILKKSFSEFARRGPRVRLSHAASPHSKWFVVRSHYALDSAFSEHTEFSDEQFHPIQSNSISRRTLHGLLLRIPKPMERSTWTDVQGIGGVSDFGFL